MRRVTGTVWVLLMVSMVHGCKKAGDTDGTEPDFYVETSQGTLSPLEPELGTFPGIVGVYNLDDDDQDGQADWSQETWMQEDNDLTTLTVVSDASTLAFSLSAPDGAIRIYSDSSVVLDADSTTWNPTPANTLELGVEFGGYLVQGMLTITDETSGSTVDIHLTSAPLILEHHLQTTERVFAMEVGFFDWSNTQMISDIKAVVGDRYTNVQAAKYDYDIWVQDEFELANLVSAETRLDVVIDSIRDGLGGGGLDDAPEDLIEGPDSVVQTWGSGWASTYDSMGNMEISPPMTIDGVSYPFGRIYYGKKGSNGPVSALTSFLDSQKVQKPFYLDTTWLCVGHIDEFTSFVPDPSAPRGFRFIYADTRLGFQLVDAADPGMSLPKYAPSQPYMGHDIANAGEMEEDSALRAYNEDIQEMYLDPILQQFKDELQLTEEEIVLLPAVFEEINTSDYPRCGAAALVPGAANLLLVNNTDGSSDAFVADPFFRSNASNPSGDAFIEAYEEAFPSSLNLHFVDDFEVYHLGLGEVHCGSNSVRTPADDWWIDAAHLLTEAGR